MRPIVVFVPLQEEMQYVYDQMCSIGASTSRAYDQFFSHYVFEVTLPTRVKIDIFFYVLGDMGNLRTAVKVIPVLLNLEPYICILTGLAGSLDPQVASLGDVVVSTRVKALYPDTAILNVGRKESNSEVS